MEKQGHVAGMFRLLLVSRVRASLSVLSSALANRDDVVEASWADSGLVALSLVARKPVDLVVADENLGDMTGLQFAERMLSVNPMVHCAVVSPLSPEAFHEASEGLGVLAQLPPAPREEEARMLLHRLKKLAVRLASL